MIKCVPVVVEEAKGSFSLAGARVSILGLIRAMAAEEVMAARLLEADHDVVATASPTTGGAAMAATLTTTSMEGEGMAGDRHNGNQFPGRGRGAAWNADQEQQRMRDVPGGSSEGPAAAAAAETQTGKGMEELDGGWG
jgi:hypothetical protein